ncbi:MAG: universal stress protein [Methanosarcinaceae archaeon]
MINSVLVPTDFTIETEDLLGCIGELKNAGLKKVILLHVVEILRDQGLAPMFERNAREKIEEYAAFVRELELEAKTLVVVGDVRKTITELAEKEDVDCIVMGATTRGIIKGRLLGRTAEYIARKSKRMLLVEKYDALKEGKEVYEKACKATFFRVLVPLDFSKEALRAVKQLSGFSRITREAVLIHIIDDIEDLDLLDEQIERALEELKKIGEHLTGIDVRYRVVEGVPSEEIKRLAEIEEVTLIMLTARGKGIIRELLLGSTAENVLRKTTKPVLLIPAEKESGEYGEEEGKKERERGNRSKEEKTEDS